MNYNSRPTSDAQWTMIYKELDDLVAKMVQVLKESFPGTTWKARPNNTLDRVVVISNEWIGGGPLVFIRFEVYFSHTRCTDVLYSQYHTEHNTDYQNDRLHNTLEEAAHMVIEEKFLAPLDYISTDILESYIENRKKNSQEIFYEI